LEQTWVAERRTARGGNYRTRQEAELHQTPGIGFGELNGVENGRFPRVQVG
jgi:hypothetical protein